MIDEAEARKRTELAAPQAMTETHDEAAALEAKQDGCEAVRPGPTAAGRRVGSASRRPSISPAASSTVVASAAPPRESPAERWFTPLLAQLSKLRQQLEEVGGSGLATADREVERAKARARARAADSLGHFPELALVASLGVLIMAVADATSKAALGFGYSEPLFWLALLVIVGPIVYRVSSAGVGSSERLALTLVAALALYLVKAIHDPYMFTFPDELVHVANANAILHSGKLFTPNNLLPATPAYPGLPAATAALASISGLSTFGAGLIVVGSARLVITLALFLLFEEVTASSRVAGIAALAYCGNPNYLFFTSEFSYESLALPLAVVVIYCVAHWLKGEETSGRPWLFCAAAVGVAVVTTHHVTSYAMVFSLLALATALRLRGDRRRSLIVGGLGLLISLATLLWLKVVAGRTATYLGEILSRAASSIAQTITREQNTRNLLSSGSAGPPPWDHALAYLWALTLLGTIVYGLFEIRSRYRRNLLALGLAAAGVSYLGVLPLRLVSGAWELANRSSEFLFIGVGLLVALACGRLVQRFRRGSMPAWTVVVVVIVVTGGALGWPRDIRTAQPLEVSAGGTVLDPPMLTAVRWAGSHLGSGHVFDGGDLDARFLGSLAHERVYAGFTPLDITDVITMSTPTIPAWGLRNLRQTHAGFVFVDRRQDTDRLRAQYFHTRTSSWSDALYSPQQFLKFDRQAGTSRIYDAGTIKIYDIRRMVDGTRSK